MFFGDTNATCQKIERMVRDGGKKCRQEPEEIHALQSKAAGKEGARKRESRKDVGRTWRGRDVERGRDRRKNEGKGEGKGQKI
jgi:hypothetical protein